MTPLTTERASTEVATSSSAAGPLVTHTHHYLAALARAIHNMTRIEAGPLVRRAAIQSFNDLETVTSGDELRAAFHHYGLGDLDVTKLTNNGGEIRVRRSLFAERSLARDTGNPQGCTLIAGLIGGILGRTHGTCFDVEEVSCAAENGGETCTFHLKPAQAESFSEVDTGFPRSWRPDAVQSPSHRCGHHYPIEQTADGMLCCHGTRVARLPVRFYATLVRLLHDEIAQSAGSKFAKLPQLLLTEAAQQAIFRSAIETGKLGPHDLTSDPETVLTSVTEIAEGLGWGRWELRHLQDGERLVVRIHDGYEAAAHQQMFGDAADAQCYFARGTLAGLMNLIYLCDRPFEAADASAYNRAFRDPSSFRAVETFCHARGDEFCEITISRLSSRF